MEASVFHTDHYVNQVVTQFLSKSQNLKFENIKNYKFNDNILFCSYGILRGTGEIFKECKNYIYLDHGYFNSSLRKFTKEKNTLIGALNGYFRVIKNDFYFRDKFYEINPVRFNKLGIPLKELNKSAEHIILSEPSENTLKFLNIPNWTEETLKKLKNYTDRNIIVHNKFSEKPLKYLMENAFAFVSCQSTAGFMCIAEGIPSYFTHKSFGDYGKIENIEDRKLNHELLFVAANSQWKLNEFFSDDFNLYLSKVIQ